MERVRRGVIALALLLVAAVAGPAVGEVKHQPREQTVEATGQGMNEKEARAQCVRQAIEQVIGVYVSAKSRNENAALIEDIIRTKSGGFGSIKRVVSQKTENGVTEITAEVVVSPVPVMQLLRQSGVLREWRVMVIIPEEIIRRPVPDPAAETEFINQFVKAGYKVIDQKRYAELRQQNVERLKDPAVAAEIGRKMGADIVITGEAFAEEIPAVMEGIASCRARVEVRALLADTAEIISADATEGPGADLSVAVAGKKALQQTAKKLAPQFVDDITLLPASDTRKLQIEVGPFRGFSPAARFEKALAAIKGVNKVHRESYDAGMLVLDIDSDVESADDLALLLEEAEAMQPFGLVVENVSKTRIRASVKPAQ